MSYGAMVIPSAMAGAGMALVFAPAASAVLGAVRPSEAGQASGANNALREVGGVFGVAVLATVFSGAGGYASPQAFTDGFSSALTVGAIVLGAGALLTALLPWREARRTRAAVKRPTSCPAIEGAASR
jgi:MFS family permease